jgi:tetratricopeptide (TPR) repeat protein
MAGLGSKLATGLAALVCAATLSTATSLADGGGGGMSGPSTSSSAPPIDVARTYQEGVAALQAGQYRDAIRSFRAVLREAPEDAAINYALALAYIGDGDHRAAKRPLERALRADAPPPGAYLQLGLVNLELGDRDKAIEQQAALADLLQRCDAACGDGRRAQLQAAYDSLTQALAAPAAPAANPTTGWIFPSEHEGRVAYAAAVGFINTEHYPEALDALARAQAAIGPHPDVLNYMGFASRRLGRTDAALAYYREALTLDPDHLGANEYLGELYLQMGRVEDARRQLARLDQLCAYGCAQREELARWIQLASN